VDDLALFFDDLLKDLSYEIYVKNHRLRYQEEQRHRYVAARAKFCTRLYFLRNRSVEDFIEDYNAFIM
jgi:hypothetical protein